MQDPAQVSLAQDDNMVDAVLEGEIDRELDDGRTSRLRQGDIVVQTGTRHAWRNPGNTSARLLFVLVGAQRSS